MFALGIVIKIAAIFNSKAKKWVTGRKNVFPEINSKISSKDKVIWMHASSLGECEQGLPVFYALKKKYPNYKFVFSFFSPSGYEIMKDKIKADLVFYLPLDTKKNAIQLIKYLHPSLVVFVKYDFWFNLLEKLVQNNIKTIFISAIFRKKQYFLKSNWCLSILKKVEFFVQDENSKEILSQLNITEVSIAGDTRFDRVKTIITIDCHLDWLTEFKGNNLLIVAGSTWNKDDYLLKEYINSKDFIHSNSGKILIVPHMIHHEYLKKLQKDIKIESLLYSELSQFNSNERKEKLKGIRLIIIDIVGILTKIYSYSDISYVGGGFIKSGVHNVLEPAVFGVPVLYGPNYHKFIEAVELVKLGGGIIIHNKKELIDTFSLLIDNSRKRYQVGNIARNYIFSKPNSTSLILDHINFK